MESPANTSALLFGSAAAAASSLNWVFCAMARMRPVVASMLTIVEPSCMKSTEEGTFPTMAASAADWMRRSSVV